jgi:hypothetical protein
VGTQIVQDRWEPAARVGVFAGYKIHSGYGWKEEVLVWDLQRMVTKKVDLSMDSARLKQFVHAPHVTERRESRDHAVSFPLKAEHDRFHF